MRITFLTHYPGPGGSSTVVSQLAGFFESQGRTVSIVAGQDHPKPVIKNYTVAAHQEGGNWRERMRRYLSTVEATRPDVVYAVSGREEYDALRCLRCARVAHFSSLEQHDWLDVPYRIQQLDGFVEAVTANTPDVLDFIRSRQKQPCVAGEAPYRIQACFFNAPDALHPSSACPGKPLDICFVGRLETIQKRAHWLPEIIRSCRDGDASIRWHIYGDGPWASEFRSSIARLNCSDAVVMHEWMDAAALARHLPGNDLFFLCSLWEGLPIAMVEAMLCGLACVVPAIPAGITFTLKDGGGWLYEASSPQACADAIRMAAQDRIAVVEKKQQAQRIARLQYAPDAVETKLRKLETELAGLRFNGNALDVNSASKMRNMRWHDYLLRRMKRLLLRPFKPD